MTAPPTAALICCAATTILFLDLPVNLGIGGNVQCGYLYAVRHGYDVAVQMDGDGQHDPAYLMEVVQPVLDGRCDMCIGSRFIKKEGFQTSFMRRVGIRWLSGMIFLLSGKRVLDVTSGFRATNARMTAYFAQHYAADYPEPEAILAASLAGFTVAGGPCHYAGASRRRVQYSQLQERLLYD